MTNPLKSEAIAKFLAAHSTTFAYSKSMECQVNVAQDEGTRIEGDYMGRRWAGWTDGLTTWKPFRIPMNANSKPTDNDSEMKFDLAQHAEGIGMTGWNWFERKSYWVAFDFDAISSGHSKGLTESEIEAVKQKACDLEWVTVRRSTSGKGLHLYVVLPGVDTENHNEHAALARSILGYMSACTGFDFSTKIDVCGGNMWVWHRKMRGTNGLEIIKQGSVLQTIPPNWRDHIGVVSGKKRRTTPRPRSPEGATNSDSNSSASLCEADEFETAFDEISGQRMQVQLDSEHQRLIEYLKESESLWWWDQDHHMLVTHTFHLKEAHEALSLKGIFETSSKGREKGADINCYLFPMPKGAWTVRRFTQGVQEATTWDQDASGWTRCYYNREPDLKSSARALGGIEKPKGGFYFREAHDAMVAAANIGAHFNLPSWALSREAVLAKHKDNRLIVRIKHEKTDVADASLASWQIEKDQWVRIFDIKTTNFEEPEVGNYDDTVRHLTTSDKDAGWVIRSGQTWNDEPLSHIRLGLTSVGIPPKDINAVLGNAVLKCWTLTNKPFQPEYPGNREWNRDAAQLAVAPSTEVDNLSYPTWNSVLDHIGAGLDNAISGNKWCQTNGIVKGSDYLKCWVASIFQAPMEPLPYLFLYSKEQNTGKSTFHECLELLLTTGVRRADNALTNQSGFNGELAHAVICVVEETDLRKHKTAGNRIKDWVTARKIPIRAMYCPPFDIPNSTHWIQCGNGDECPIFPGDTRITMIQVPPFETVDLIPKKMLLNKLTKEAPDFVAAMLRLEIPAAQDRLNIPVIETDEKRQVAATSQNALDTFIEEHCYFAPGKAVKFSEFCDKFWGALEMDEVAEWSKNKISRNFPIKYAKGRSPQGANHYLGNMSFDPAAVGDVANLLRLETSGYLRANNGFEWWKELGQEEDQDDRFPVTNTLS